MSNDKWYERKVLTEWLEYERRRLAELKIAISAVQRDLQIALRDTELVPQWQSVWANAEEARRILGKAIELLSTAEGSLKEES